MRITMSILAMFGLLIAVVVGESTTVNAAEQQQPEKPSLQKLAELAAAASAAENASADMQQGETTVQVEKIVSQPVEAPEIEGDVIPKWQLRDASIRSVLRQLAVSSRRNILTSPKVTGNVSADLFDVTIYEALEAILKVNGFDYVEQGDFIYVYTAEELQELQDAERKTMTRIFELKYIKPADAKGLIKSYLSTEGKIASTPDSEKGIAPSQEETGGMDYALNDVVIVTDYEENLERIEELLKQADKQPMQVLIEATIMVATLDEDNQLGVSLGTDAIKFHGSDLIVSSITNIPTLGGINAGWVGNQAEFIVSAVEGITDVNVLANPKLLILNKQRGEIIVGREQGYYGKFTLDEDGNPSAQEVETLNTGTRMIVRPFIGDNGYIRLEIHPEDSFGLINEDKLPEKSTSECTSNILVRDGHTIVISGMFRESTTTTKTQVPILGSIPVLGMAFRFTQDVVERQEMIILITPHIINHSNDESISVQAGKNVDKFRRQMLDNLQWYGRTKMAMRYFNWARDLAASDHDLLARFNVDMALKNNPIMKDAIDLKEKLTGKQLAEDQPILSDVRYLLEKMILEDINDSGSTAEPMQIQQPQTPQVQDIPEPADPVEPAEPEVLETSFVEPKALPKQEPEPKQALSANELPVDVHAQAKDLQHNENQVLAHKLNITEKKESLKEQKQLDVVSEPARPVFDLTDPQPQVSEDTAAVKPTAQISSVPLFDLP